MITCLGSPAEIDLILSGKWCWVHETQGEHHPGHWQHEEGEHETGAGATVQVVDMYIYHHPAHITHMFALSGMTTVPTQPRTGLRGTVSAVMVPVVRPPLTITIEVRSVVGPYRSIILQHRSVTSTQRSSYLDYPVLIILPSQFTLLHITMWNNVV